MTEAVLLRLLDEGGPLKYGNFTLRTLEPMAVPRFALPAEPESAEAMAARRAGQAQPSSAGRAIARAVFAEGRLWLLDGNGRLSSLAEGETRLRSEEVGEEVLDLCVQGGAPVALTGRRDGGANWTVRQLTGGTWRATRAIARAGDSLVALSCGDGVAMAFTTRRLIDLEGTVPDLAIAPTLRLPQVSAAPLVTPDAAWLGIDAGEWGGGLRRIDRRTGAVSTIARNATGGLCDGPLNTDCDPVNGIVAIPWRPGCVAVAIGLIHMVAHGRIAAVCPQGVEQLFAVAGAVDPGDPGRVAEAARGGSGSVAFFGLAATADALLAVGHNGLYRIDARGVGTRRPWPRFTEVDGLLVSFALPDVVLVMTAINGRASLSGITPLMAVR